MAFTSFGTLSTSGLVAAGTTIKRGLLGRPARSFARGDVSQRQCDHHDIPSIILRGGNCGRRDESLKELWARATRRPKRTARRGVPPGIHIQRRRRATASNATAPRTYPPTVIYRTSFCAGTSGSRISASSSPSAACPAPSTARRSGENVCIPAPALVRPGSVSQCGARGCRSPCSPQLPRRRSASVPPRLATPHRALTAP